MLVTESSALALDARTDDMHYTSLLPQGLSVAVPALRIHQVPPKNSAFFPKNNVVFARVRGASPLARTPMSMNNSRFVSNKASSYRLTNSNMSKQCFSSELMACLSFCEQ